MENEIEIETRGGEVSFFRYREKNKNDALLNILSKIITDKNKFEWIENWVRGLEGTKSLLGENNLIYCG